jgi:hypothetical protein
MYRFWMSLILFSMKRLGFRYLIIKRDPSGQWVEAITVSNSEAYIDEVEKIKMQLQHS